MCLSSCQGKTNFLVKYHIKFHLKRKFVYQIISILSLTALKFIWYDVKLLVWQLILFHLDESKYCFVDAFFTLNITELRKRLFALLMNHARIDIHVSVQGSDDEDPTNSVPMNGSKKLVSRDSVEMTCSRLSGANRYLQKLTYDEDIIDIMLNGSSPDLASNSFGDEANENKLNNKHRSVSLTSLQSMAKGSINDIDVDEQESWWRQARRKSFGKILNIGANKVDRDTGNLKRPSIVLSNSQESVVVFDCDEAMPNDCGAVSDNSEPYPKTQFLNFDLINDSRRTTLTPLVDSTTQTFVEPLTQIQDITRLAATHWSQLPIYKERWLYCWHPLSFLDTF